MTFQPTQPTQPTQPPHPPQAPQSSENPTGPYHAQGTPPPPPPAWQPYGQAPPEAEVAATAGGKTLPLPTILQIVAAVLTVVSLVLSPDGAESWYESTTAWSIFATVAAIVQLAPTAGKSIGWSAERSWTIGAVGAGGLFAWWVLIALPAVSSDQGFTATMAVAAAIIGSWLSPGRRL